MQFYKKFLRLILVLSIGIFVLSGCGSSDDSKKTDDKPKNTDTNKISDIKLNTKDLTLKNIDSYTIVTSNKSTSVKDNNITLEKNKKDLIALVDDAGIPILFGRKYPGKEKAELSLDSSAEVFVLYSPKFQGIKDSNQVELSKRIRNNKDFSKLKKAIKNEINNGNPCPLDPVCNFKARDIALEIANEIKIDDLISK